MLCLITDLSSQPSWGNYPKPLTSPDAEVVLLTLMEAPPGYCKVNFPYILIIDICYLYWTPANSCYHPR